MSNYRYLSRDKSGRSLKGVMPASSPAEVAALLGDINQTPISIGKVYELKILRWFKNGKRVKPVVFIMYNRQFATLLRAGLPIINALETLEKQTGDKKLKSATTAIINSINAGNTLADSFRQHMHIFSKAHINMVRSAEESGRLPEVLDRIAGMAEYDFITQRKIIGALFYPCIVITFIAIAFVVMIYFVLPKFIMLFQGLDIPLPLPTKIFLGISDIIQGYGKGLLAVVIAGVVLFRLWLLNPAGRLRWDTIKLKIPIFGHIILGMVVSRLCRTFGMLIQSGVPVLSIFSLLKDTTGNKAFSTLLEEAGRAVERGHAISTGFENSDIVSPLFSSMLKTGEKTGQLDKMLFRVAEHYEMELDYRVKNLTTAIEPLLLLFIGATILLLALAIFTPIWNMYLIGGM